MQLADKLPAVEGVKKIDVARLAAEHLNGQVTAFIKIREGFWLGLQPYFNSSSFMLEPPLEIYANLLMVFINDDTLRLTGMNVL